MQLSDDDSTSVTKLEERKEREENGPRVAMVFVRPDGDGGGDSGGIGVSVVGCGGVW